MGLGVKATETLEPGLQEGCLAWKPGEARMPGTPGWEEVRGAGWGLGTGTMFCGN